MTSAVYSGHKETNQKQFLKTGLSHDVAQIKSQNIEFSLQIIKNPFKNKETHHQIALFYDFQPGWTSLALEIFDIS